MTQILSFALVALLVFWMLGAYNRVMRLRQEIGLAWAKVDELLLRRESSLDALVAAVRPTLAAEQGSFDALQAARDQLLAAAASVRPRPAATTALAGLATAEAMLASTVTRLLSLVEQHPGLPSDPSLPPLQTALADQMQQLGFARQLFNEAVDRHNAAIAEFPTRLLGRVFGFREASGF